MDTDMWDMVRYPLTIRMEVILCNLLSSSKLRRFLSRSFTQHRSEPLPRIVGELRLQLRQCLAIDRIRRWMRLLF